MGIEVVVLSVVAAGVALRLRTFAGADRDPGAGASVAWWLTGTGLGAAALGLLPLAGVGDVIAASAGAVCLLLGGLLAWLARARGWREDREGWRSGLPDPERAGVARIVEIHGRLDDLEEGGDEGPGWLQPALAVLGCLAVVTSLVAVDVLVFLLGGLLLAPPVQGSLEWQARRHERGLVSRLLSSTGAGSVDEPPDLPA